MVTTECATCIHFEVCGLKSCIDEAAAKVDTSKAGLVHPEIEVLVKCRQYRTILQNGLMTYAPGVR